MLNQGGGAFLEYLKFLRNKLPSVIDALGSVSANVVLQATKDRIRRTIKHNEGANVRYRTDIIRLSLVAGNAVEAQDIAGAKTGTLKIDGYDLARKGEVFVLKQTPEFEDFADK